jgi:predicted dehydrogenase
MIKRRAFLKSAAATAAAAAIVPRVAVAGSGETPPSEKLNLAFIGAGGRARANLGGLKNENVVALCDVDLAQAKQSFAEHSKARQFRDFRRMLDDVEKQVDAVVVSTPDHTHAVAVIAALERGKHVYCEKPLAHTVAEVRAMRAAAGKAGVVTQLGNQGHSYDHIRVFCEWIWDGAIGDVTEVHALYGKRGSSYTRIDSLGQVAEEHPIPETLDWDLWLGPVAYRPYHPLYLPGKWRGWAAFGTGSIGDWTCHMVDPIFWALDLGAPARIQAEVTEYDPKAHKETFPRGAKVRYEFPALGNRGPVALYWYEGDVERPRPDGLEADEEVPMPGAFVVGTKGKIRYGSHGANGLRIFPEEKMQAYKRPAPTLPRVANHYVDWTDAIRTGGKAGSHFDYGGPLTEVALLGAIAMRNPGAVLDWDADAMRFTNCEAANEMLSIDYRDGWKL